MTDIIDENRPSRLAREEFLARYGGVYEASPWVAEAVWHQAERGALDTLEALAAAMQRVVDEAGDAVQLVLIRAHPDLAGKAARAGDLTPQSTQEQAGAGLNRLSDTDYQRFHALNTAYRERFGFPFIIAVKGHSATSILAAFESRLANSPETELGEALAQIHRIAGFRLADISAGEGA